jgi:hypothetical protein
MTFRGSFEQDVREFAEQDADMQAATADEDDDAVETLMALIVDSFELTRRSSRGNRGRHFHTIIESKVYT